MFKNTNIFPFLDWCCFPQGCWVAASVGTESCWKLTTFRRTSSKSVKVETNHSGKCYRYLLWEALLCWMPYYVHEHSFICCNMEWPSYSCNAV